MKKTNEAKEAVVSFRVKPIEKVLLRHVFEESKNYRKFLLAAIQDPENRKRIKEVINEKQE